MSMKLKPLDEQVIVITGASSGIGLATAESAAGAGAKVVLAARSGDTLDEVVDRIRAAGGQAVAAACDVADRQQVQAVADKAIAAFGRIDTWVNDAGVSIYARLDQTTNEDGHRLFETNFWGVVNGCLVALPFLKQNGGCLINVGSEVSDAYIPFQGMYTASKHAVKGYTDTLRVEIEELDKAPVAVTLIQPTAVNTPYPEHAKNYMEKRAKLPDPQIDPQQVADAILKAATSPTRYVKVGMMAHINTNVAKFAPAVADKMSAKIAEKQFYDEKELNPDGALHQAGGTGQTHGAGPRAGSA
jgi:short-subunit dehydrogenase